MQELNNVLMSLVNKSDEELLDYAKFVLQRCINALKDNGFNEEDAICTIYLFVTTLITSDGKYSGKESDFCKKLFGTSEFVDIGLKLFDKAFYKEVIDTVKRLPRENQIDLCMLAGCVVSCDREITRKEIAYMEDMLL